MKYYTMIETREFLESIGMPGGDLYDLPTSEKRFPDGGQYRFEVPGIQGPGPMKALLEALDEYGIKIHRVTQTKGIMFLTDDEIRQMVEYAKKWDVQLILACGPRATTDTSASVKTEEGQRMGYRLRGEEQIVRGIEEIKRGARLGVRGFLIYDEGLLFALNVLESLGADSINPVRDIQIQMLASMRAAIDVPIDLHTENPKSSGGFIRHYEVPDFIRVAAPVYLKTGGSVAANHSYDTTEKEARQRAKQVMLVKRVIDEYYPDAIVSPK